MTPRSAQSPDLGERVEQQEHVGQSLPRPKGSGKIHPSPNSILGATGPEAGRTEPAPSLEERVGQDSPTVLYLPAVRDSSMRWFYTNPGQGRK